MTTDEIARHAGEVFETAGSWDEALKVLRADGHSKVEAVRATVDVLGQSLADAKVTVHNSAAWADRRLADDDFHDGLEHAAESEQASRR